MKQEVTGFGGESWKDGWKGGQFFLSLGRARLKLLMLKSRPFRPRLQAEGGNTAVGCFLGRSEFRWRALDAVVALCLIMIT